MFEREIWDCRFDYVPDMRSDVEIEAEAESKESGVRSEELEEINLSSGVIEIKIDAKNIVCRKPTKAEMKEFKEIMKKKAGSK